MWLLLYKLERPNLFENRFENIGRRYPSDLSHLTEVDRIFDLYSHPKIEIVENSSNLTDFFSKFKTQLHISCRDHRIFSHCQPHYLLTYNTNTGLFSSYSKTPCI